VKRFPYIEGATYPDCGCNFETYTAGDFMEVETLAPLTKLQPNESVTHIEQWYLFNVEGVDAGATGGLNRKGNLAADREDESMVYGGATTNRSGGSPARRMTTARSGGHGDRRPTHGLGARGIW